MSTGRGYGYAPSCFWGRPTADAGTAHPVRSHALKWSQAPIRFKEQAARTHQPPSPPNRKQEARQHDALGVELAGFSVLEVGKPSFPCSIYQPTARQPPRFGGLFLRVRARDVVSTVS